MSTEVQTEVSRIEQNVANTYAVLAGLGADMPAEQNSDNLARTAGTVKAVLYSAQTLTEAQKTKARQNIGAVSKDGLTLGIHTDGLVYVFVDGVPVGNGIEMGVSGDVFGYVDENNNIVVQGSLPDGTYTVKYEMEDGSKVNIGDLVLDSNVYYTVTNTLTNCVTSNSATEAVGGQPYSAVISANDGYELSSVTVTMGGNPVTVSGGNISIAEVTGDIVITAVATEIQTGPAYTNLAEPDATATGETAWNSGGWCNDSYMAGSSYAYRSGTTGRVTTNTFAVEHGDTIYVKGIKYAEDSTCQIAIFDSNKGYISHKSAAVLQTNSAIKDLTGTAGEDYWYFKNANGTDGSDIGTRFVRLAGYLSGTVSDVIITRNQPIV